MNCPEAVEWMHRYIDRDLNEEESSLLFQHIRSCSDCAEEFEMLNMLSTKLEQLPKVTPKFSLVDSILPQLDAIDRARREEGSAAEIISEMIPAVTTDRNDSLRNRSNRRPQTSRRRRAYVSGTLGLTAALILGMFIYQYEPHTMSDAEVALSSYDQDIASTESAPAADKAASADSMSSNEFVSDDVNGAGNSSRQEAQGTGNANDDGVVDAGIPSNDSMGKTVEPSAPASSASKAPSKGTSNPSDSTKEASPASNGGDGNLNSAPSAPIAPSNEKSSPINEEDAVGFENGAANQPLNDSHGDMMMGIARFSANEWPSPDGKYVIEQQGDHLQLYQYAESQEPKLLSEVVMDGEWISGEWSQDSLIFTYEVEKDGATAKHTITTIQ